jgi:hypothetical protein
MAYQWFGFDGKIQKHVSHHILWGIPAGFPVNRIYTVIANHGRSKTFKKIKSSVSWEWEPVLLKINATCKGKDCHSFFVAAHYVVNKMWGKTVPNIQIIH